MQAAIYGPKLLDTSDTSDGSNGSDSTAPSQSRHPIKMGSETPPQRRPRSFPSQAKLFSWIERNKNNNHLNRAKSLTLHITDVDLSPLLSQGPSTRRKHTTAWSLYQDELARLEAALRALPNLTSMVVFPPRESHSMLLKTFYRDFLALIPSRCPKIKRLELKDGEELLREVPELNAVRRVLFIGSRSEKTSSLDAGCGGPSSSSVKQERRDSDSERSAESASKRAKGGVTSSHLGPKTKTKAAFQTLRS